MRWLLLLLVTLMLGMFGPTASAHAVAVNLDAFVENRELVVLANGPQGEPINGAVMQYELLSTSGQVSSERLRAVADGEYRAFMPMVQSGEYTLRIADTTFPQEALQVAANVQMPLVNPVRMLLPPSSAGQPNSTLLIVLAAIPVVIALLAVGIILITRPKLTSSMDNEAQS
jgi:hypothetical protein